MKKTVQSFSLIDRNNWSRNSHLEFFTLFERPFWGICTSINCTNAKEYCTSFGFPFFYYYLFLTLKAVNSVKSFKYRLVKDQVREYKRIDGSITVLRSDGTFGFAYIEYHESFQKFCKEAKEQIRKEKLSSGLESQWDRINVVHISIIPFIQFSQLEHAYFSLKNDSIPKISIGKYTENLKCWTMPISVHVHHGFCDAIHVSEFIEKLQSLLELS